MGIRGGVCLASALAALAITAPAHGAVTIGSDLDVPTIESKPCPALVCTAAYASSDFAHPRSAPVTGVIVRWRLRQGANAGPADITLRVLRPDLSSPSVPLNWTGVRSGATVNVPAVAGTYEFPERLPIAVGDGIGLDFPSAHANFLGPDEGANPPYTRVHFLGAFPNGSSTGTYDQYANELLINADIELDADGDGLGDETQDRCTGDPNPQAVCSSNQTKTACKKKKGKHRKRIADTAKKKKKKKCKKRRKKGKH